MKRIVVLWLTALLLFSVSIAYANDCSSMTEEQLKEQYNSIRNELTTRGLKAENKTTFLDEAGVQIYINGSPSVDKEWSGLNLIIPIIIINNSNKSIAVTMNDTSVNGWTVTDFSSSIDSSKVAAGKKAKASMKFALEDTDVETIEDFEEVEFTLTIYDDNDWFGDKVLPKTAPITIYASKAAE